MGGAVIEQEAGDPIPQEAQVNSPVLAVIKDLTRKLADINHCEVVLDTSNFNEDVIPPEQRAIVLDSLAQTLKFSIKNSIESPAERLTLNKGPEANVALTCSYQENIGGLDVPGVVLSYQDDGRGLNTREVFECAKKSHLTNTNSAEELRKEEVVGFLFDEAF